MAEETLSKIRPLECRCIGKVHLAIVKNPGKVGRVTNVFERTINVRTEHGELLVITLDSTKSPVNLNVSSGDDPPTRFSGLAREGQRVLMNHAQAGDRTVLQVGDIAVSIDMPGVFENSLIEPVAGFLHTFAAEIDEIIPILAAAAEKRRGCLLNPDMTTEGLLGSFLILLETPDVRKDRHVVAGALAELCGRGPGFTPAGDDFIAGYLAAYNWLGRALRQWPSIIPGAEFSRLTTWTSFKLMEYSAKGLLDEQAQSMLNSVAAGDVPNFVRCIENMSRRGHTSGVDFATGAVAGLSVASDSLFATNALGSISSIMARKAAQLS